MAKWLAIGAATLIWTGSASAQVSAFKVAGEIPVEPSRHAHDVRMPQQREGIEERPAFGGMLVSRDVAPNATLGLALVSSRKKSSATFGINAGSGHRKPALTFRLRF